jgi:hypothetical protein
MKKFRVQKVTPAGEVIEEAEIAAGSAEEAACALVPGALYRGTRGQRAVLRAKVYSPDATGTATLVRFYEREDMSPADGPRHDRRGQTTRRS